MKKRIWVQAVEKELANARQPQTRHFFFSFGAKMTASRLTESRDLDAMVQGGVSEALPGARGDAIAARYWKSRT